MTPRWHEAKAKEHAETARKCARAGEYENASRWYRSAAYHVAIAEGLRLHSRKRRKK